MIFLGPQEQVILRRDRSKTQGTKGGQGRAGKESHPGPLGFSLVLIWLFRISPLVFNLGRLKLEDACTAGG